MATEGGLGRPDHGNRPMCYSLPTAGVAIVALERLAPFCARARFMNTTLGHEKTILVSESKRGQPISDNLHTKELEKGHNMEKVGIVGVGAMGSALLERLKLAGVEATAFDIARLANETARSLGALGAPSAKAVGQASTIIDVVVRTDHEVLDCTMSKDGILEGAEAGTLLLLHSTILPETTKKVADAARSRKVHVIDACMTAVPKIVRQGGLTFLVGGPADLVERARPHLLRMAKAVMHMGPLGAGNVAKLIKNLVTASEALIIHEAIRIGQAGGIPCEEALEMMRKTRSESTLNRWRERFDISGAIPTLRASRNVYDKDIPLAVEVGRQFGLDMPITEQLAAAGLRLIASRG